MNDTQLSDDQKFDHAVEHAQMMRDQKKETVTSAGGKSYEIQESTDNKKP